MSALALDQGIGDQRRAVDDAVHRRRVRARLLQDAARGPQDRHEQGGRNHHGHITMRRRGGRHKRSQISAGKLLRAILVRGYVFGHLGHLLLKSF